MVRTSGAVSFVVPAIGISFIALKRCRMKSMQEPKAPDWNDSWNEIFQALFACWFVCLFEIRAIGLSSAAGLSEQLICNITKWRLLFQKPRHFHCHYWLEHAPRVVSWTKIVTSGFFFTLYVNESVFFSGAPPFLATAQQWVSGTYPSLLVLFKQKSSSLGKVHWLPVKSTGSRCLFSPLKNSADGVRAVPESNRRPTVTAKTRHHQH